MTAVAVLGALAGAQALKAQTQTAISCGMVVSAPANITVTNDLFGCTSSGVTITSSNVTLDCNGHTIAGTKIGSGITVKPTSGNGPITNVLIRNCHVRDFGNNFYLQTVDSSTLDHDTSLGNTSTGGFFLVSSNKNTLTNDIAMGGVKVGTSRGFSLSGSSGNLLGDNVAVGNQFRGFELGSSSMGNRVRGNTAVANGSAGYVVFGGSTGNVFTGDRAFSDESEGFIVFSDSSGNTFSNNESSGNGRVSGGADCVDGTGVAANWTANIGGTSSPAGICPN
jgi:parallel beta-helix repeat protein